MKSHILVGMALALAILALVSVSPEVADARDAGVQTQNLALGLDGVNGGGSGDGPVDEPGVETLNGDPEDWLGGQNVRPIPPKPGSNDDPPVTILEQIESVWKSLIRSLEELAR